MKKQFKFLLIGALICSVTALAQEAEDPNALGWKKSAKLGTNLSFSSSQDVVGQSDGNSETYGLNLKGEFRRNGRGDEWRSETSLLTSTTKTPAVPHYVKSSDELKLNTMYLQFWNDSRSFGPYARLEATAPMFKGEDRRAASSTYRITARDQTSTTTTGSSFRLTDGFKPLTTKESLGFFWKPVNEERLKVEARVGAAAMQIDADGQYTLAGTNAANEILVNELTDVNQAGLEAAVSAKGKVDDKSSYEVGIESLTPFINNKAAADKRDALRLTNVDAFLKLTSNITSWASFGYDYKMKLQPQLVNRPQQIHMIVINVSYNLL